jgi:ankyrin repeat protein
MHSVNPKFIVLLVAVIVAFATFHLVNPHRKYSTQQFWEEAAADAVYEIPSAALEVGNKNGPVLMWAAMTAQNPQTITRLINRGANPNEADLFGGTALTGAAAYNSNPEIIRTLVKAGADINQTVRFDDSALIIAARYATNPTVIETLIELGADPAHENVKGRNALDYARFYKNNVGIQVLGKYTDEEDAQMQTQMHTATASPEE